MGFLDETAPTGRSNLEEMHSSIKEVLERYTAEDGLVDFGEKTIHYLETRTDGYQYRVAIATSCWSTPWPGSRSWPGRGAMRPTSGRGCLRPEVDRRPTAVGRRQSLVRQRFPRWEPPDGVELPALRRAPGHSLTPAQKQALAGTFMKHLSRPPRDVLDSPHRSFALGPRRRRLGGGASTRACPAHGRVAVAYGERHGHGTS